MKMRKTFSHPGKPAVNVGRFSEKATESDTLLVLLGCADLKIYIWDYLSHTIEKVLTGHAGPVCDFEISIDSRVLISAARESRILRWNLVRGTAEAQLKGHHDGVVVAEVAPKTQKVVTGAKDNRIIVWNTVGPSAGKQALSLLLHTGNVSCLALSADGSQLLSGSWDTTVCLTDLLTPQVIRRFRGHIGAVLGCCIGGEAENVLVSCCRAGRLIRWDLTGGKAMWNMSLGGPARCLAFKPGGLLVVGCDKDFAIQVWDLQGKRAGTGKDLLKHKGEISGLVSCQGGRMICSSDRAGQLVFWDEVGDEFEPKGTFTCEVMSSGIESISVESSYLVCSTCQGHVLLFEMDETLGLMPGTAPCRVWQHHLGRVPCVRLLAHEGAPVKVVSASYDNRVFIHPSGEGTALWFSWRPIMNAVRNRQHSLFHQLLNDQKTIVHEKIYPIGWTLLHALVDLGDLRAIQVLFSIAGSEPLGFTTDADGRTPLDIGCETAQTGILDYLLSQAQYWPQHVLEFSTKSVCKLVPMSLASMPAFLDSRLFEPLPDYGVPAPSETIMSSNFSSTKQSIQYFEAVGMGGSLVPSLSEMQYAQFGIALKAHTVAERLSFAGDDEHKDDDGKVHLNMQLQKFLQGVYWMVFITFVVLADVIVTLIGTLAKIDEENKSFLLVGWIILGAFFVDIVLRIAAYQSEFFNGSDRYMNIFELIIVVVCVVLEVTDSTLPVSMGRLLRPVIRLSRLVRIIFRFFVLSTARARAGIEGTMPISTKCLYLNYVLDHKEGILRYLVNSRQPDLFKSVAVRAILEYKWKRYAKSHHLRNFAIFLLYVLCWTTYAAITYMEDNDGVEKKYKDLLAFILVAFSLWYVAREIRKLLVGGFLAYISSGWNILNIVCSSVLCVLIVLEFMNDHDTKSRDLAAVVSPFMWIQSFNYLRGFRGTGALVRMIIVILYDIRYFVLIMFIMTVAFTQSFFILDVSFLGLYEEPVPAKDKPWEIAWQVYNTAWLGAQWNWYQGPILERVLYLFMTFFQLVVLMNLLIAIMGDTFGRVMEGAIVEFYRNFAALINELEVLMTPREHQNTGNFPHYFLFSQKEMFEEATGDDAEDGNQKEEDTAIRSTLDQIRVEIKTLQRNTAKIVDTVVEHAADRSDVGSYASRRQQFHV